LTKYVCIRRLGFVSKFKKIALTEDNIRTWINEMSKGGDINQPNPKFELLVKNRLSKLELKFGWERDEYVTAFGKSWQILMWKEVVGRLRKRRLLVVAVQNSQGYYKFEYKKIRVKNFLQWMNEHGRSVCPKCKKFVQLKWLQEYGLCTDCWIKEKVNKCQVCGEVKPNTMKPWDIEMCKHLRLDSLLPLCEHCKCRAYEKFHEIRRNMKRMNEDLWVRSEGGRYKLKIWARPIEGNEEVFVYAFSEKPTKKEIRNLMRPLLGYVEVKFSITDLGLLN
jgi:hypothetical protein